ncbi:DUF4352 domain-containing protein [Paenibacillus sp. FJAT-26967]|uniref:DUF4352 domain-containing protein n=1 Tax=Paenibacillus sp. FJAT-26967 TaxID=1729690 RepID=UPI00083897DC|nr:DUF4352 domain-containing protein [Paenibacillus sp. FJAT-26967]
MKKVFKIGCLGFVMLFVLGIVISMLSVKDDPGTTTANSAANVSANEKPEATKQPAKEAQIKSIGEELKVGDVVFKVNKVSTTKEIKDGPYLSYKTDSDGSVFYIVNVTVKNDGTKMISTDSSFFQLKKGEVTYTPSMLITTSQEFFLFDGINPGLSKTGNVAFEVPKDVTDFVLNVQTGFFGTEQGQIKLK